MAFTVTNLLGEDNIQYLDGQECISYKEYYAIKKFINKFENDKSFYEDDNYIIILDGVLLNKTELYKNYETNDLKTLITKMYLTEGEEFFNRFRGSFSGALYNKNIEKWIFYTNHYGDNMLFYYICGRQFVISSSVLDIINILKLNSIQLNINEKAIVSMLTYGYMSDDFTYAKEIVRLKPGNYIVISEFGYSTHSYYRLKNNVYDLNNRSEDEIINEIDTKFKNAVRLEYGKDLEYGYNHISELSGGLDSRMSLWVAKELGFNNITCITFAESGSMDENVAKSIARDLGFYLFHLPLDSAKHLLDIEKYTQINYGLQFYSAVGGEKAIMDAFCMDKFGLMHTGQIGDVVIGTFIQSKDEIEDLSFGGLYSARILNKSIQDKEYIYNLLDVEKYKEIYNNREIYLMY